MLVGSYVIILATLCFHVQPPCCKPNKIFRLRNESILDSSSEIWNSKYIQMVVCNLRLLSSMCSHLACYQLHSKIFTTPPQISLSSVLHQFPSNHFDGELWLQHCLCPLSAIGIGISLTCSLVRHPGAVWWGERPANPSPHLRDHPLGALCDCRPPGA